MADKTHWENIYLTKSSKGVSWYQEHAELSIRFMQKTGVGQGSCPQSYGPWTFRQRPEWALYGLV